MDIISRLKDSKNNIPDWLYNSLKLRNPNKDISLRPYYDFLFQESDRVEGDFAEFGVFRGDSVGAVHALMSKVKSIMANMSPSCFLVFIGYPPYDRRAWEYQDEKEMLALVYHKKIVFLRISRFFCVIFSLLHPYYTKV